MAVPSKEKQVGDFAAERLEDVDFHETKAGLSVDELDPDHHLTRKVLWKLDTRILPVLALLFLCSFLDRTNVGNAKILGLEKTIHVNDHQYASGLAIFFAFYIASEVPRNMLIVPSLQGNLVLKKISPRIWLPFLTFAWGVIGMCLGFVENFAGFLVVRAFLGIAEGGLLPGMVLYLSGMYTRGELALRIGLFYTTASLSGAFGGLLARGLSAISTTSVVDAGWRWIMIVEGILTAVVAIVAYFLLPNDIASAKFLTEEERGHATRRLLMSTSSRLSTPYANAAEPERFKWSEVRRAVLDPSMWLSATAYFSILSGLYSFGLFLPTIINGLEYSANEAQLWSVIPYAVAAVVTVFVAFMSDRLLLRGPVMLCTLPLAIVGYAVIGNVENNNVKFGMTFLMATGLYASVPPVLVWISNNSMGHYKRATATGLQLAIANCGGFVSAFTYQAVEKPQYHKSHTIILGLLVYAWFGVLLNILWCWKVNRDKASGKYDQYAGCGDDREPDYKLIL